MEFVLAYVGPKLAAKLLVPLVLKLLLKLGIGGVPAAAIAAKIPEWMSAILGKVELGKPLTPEEKERLTNYRQRDEILHGRSGFG